MKNSITRTVVRVCLLSLFLGFFNHAFSQTLIDVGLNVTNTSNNGYINITSTSTNFSYLNFKNGGSAYWHLDGPNSSEVYNPFSIHYYNGTTFKRYFNILNNGNIGIGTSTPNASLQFGNTYVNRKIVLYEAANNDYNIFGFGVTESGNLRYQIPTNTSAFSHVFQAGNSVPSSVELMRIRGDGKVGIGVQAPLAKLHVRKGAFIVEDSSGTDGTSITGAGIRLMWIPSKFAFRAGRVSGSQWDAANIGDNSAAFGYDNLASGNASFAGGMSNSVSGTSSAAFGYNNIVSAGGSGAFGNNNTVSGSNSFLAGANSTIIKNFSTSLGYQNTSNGEYSFTIGRLNYATADYAFTLGTRNIASAYRAGAIGFFTKASADYAFTIGTGIDSTNSLENTNSQSLMIGFNSNKPTLFVKGASGLNMTGAVAIATTTIPSTAPTGGYKFVVAGNSYLNGSVVIGDQSTITASTTFPSGYKLYVTDGILTEKVKVALKSSSAWADFVFDKDYELMPLDSVETYIKENKHLPSIPSAADAVKNGVDLLEMDAKLLQKVEELTLYIIEQRKEIQELKKKVEKLENK